MPRGYTSTCGIHLLPVARAGPPCPECERRLAEERERPIGQAKLYIGTTPDKNNERRLTDVERRQNRLSKRRQWERERRREQRSRR